MSKDRRFVTVNKAAVRAETTVYRITKLIEAGAVTTRHLPGSKVEVLVEDIDRIARESVVPAMASA